MQEEYVNKYTPGQLLVFLKIAASLCIFIYIKEKQNAQHVISHETPHLVSILCVDMGKKGPVLECLVSTHACIANFWDIMVF